MAFAERISRGWLLTRQSFGVLMLDKEMLVFPMISAVAAILVTASFVAPLWSSGYLQTIGDSGETPSSPLFYVWLFAFYFANYFVMIFFSNNTHGIKSTAQVFSKLSSLVIGGNIEI